MTELGLALTSEQLGPNELVERAKRAERPGFDHVAINQVKPDADVFFDVVESELVPAVP